LSLGDKQHAILAGKQTEESTFKGKFIDFGKINEMTEQEQDEFAATLFSDETFTERRKDLNGNIIYNSEEVQSKFT
jgi:hypothetical protein